MDRMRQIYSEQIEPYTDTFSRLSHCLMQATVMSSVLNAMQSLHPPYTKTCARRFLSHYMVCFYAEDVVGDTGEMSQRVAQSAMCLFTVHREHTCPSSEFMRAFGTYLNFFNEWQRFDKAKLASTYRDVYHLLSEIRVSSPIEMQEPVEKLQRTIDKQTKQIFGPDAHKVRNERCVKEGDCRELEQFVLSSVHEMFWDDMTRKVEQNEYGELCGVIRHVKDRMLALCTNPVKCEEVSAFLDAEFLQKVLNVGMAQKQVKSLLSYCLCFLREYGQPCRDIELAELQRTTDSLYTLDTSNSIPLLVGLIREIAQRIDELVGIVSGLFIPSESHPPESETDETVIK